MAGSYVRSKSVHADRGSAPDLRRVTDLTSTTQHHSHTTHVSSSQPDTAAAAGGGGGRLVNMSTTALTAVSCQRPSRTAATSGAVASGDVDVTAPHSQQQQRTDELMLTANNSHNTNHHHQQQTHITAGPAASVQQQQQHLSSRTTTLDDVFSITQHVPVQLICLITSPPFQAFGSSSPSVCLSARISRKPRTSPNFI